jgi:hypothetical protein
MKEIAEEADLVVQISNWDYPRQKSWAIFAKPNFEFSLISAPGISWNYTVSTVSDTA